MQTPGQPTRDGTSAISYSDGTITVDSVETLAYEPDCCASGRAVVTLRWDGKRIVLVGVRHLPGPTSITANGIGALNLGMTAQQLSSLGYRGEAGAGGCQNYNATGKPPVIYDPVRHQVVAIAGIQGSRTHPGGFGIGDQPSLAQLTSAFPHYRITSYFKHDLGHGGTGLTVTDPAGWLAGSGSIGFVLAAVPDAYGEVKINAIRVGNGLNATAVEPSCR